MAESQKYIVPEALEEESKNVKTVVVHINIPGLKVKQSPPLIGAVKLTENCTVNDDPFKKDSVQVIATVEKDGKNIRYKYELLKLPGEIIPQECKIEYKDGMIILTLMKAKPDTSWEVEIKSGLRKMNYN